MFIALLILIQFVDLTFEAGSKCNQILNQDALYSLGPLSDKKDFTHKFNESHTIYFRFCQYTEHQCVVNGTNYQTYASLVNDKDKTCTPLTGGQLLQNYFFELIDEENPGEGVQLYITGGPNKTSVNFVIYCNDEMDAGLSNIDTAVYYSDSDENVYIIEGESPQGCPVLQVSEIWIFFDDHAIIFSLISIIFGGILCFYGRRLLQPSLFILGYLVSFMIIVLFLTEFVISVNSSPLLIWFLLAFDIIISVFLGYFAMKIPRVGIACAGIWLGFIIALLMQNAFLYKIASNNIAFYIVLIILSIVFAYFGWQYYDQFLVAVTSLFGAYMVFKPIAYYTGDYPTELHITKLVQYQQMQSIPTNFYFYLIGIIILAVIGGSFQRYQKLLGLAQIQFNNLSSLNQEQVQNETLEMGQLPEYVELKEALSRNSKVSKSGSFKKIQEPGQDFFEQQRYSVRSNSPIENRKSSGVQETQDQQRHSIRSNSPIQNRASSSSGNSSEIVQKKHTSKAQFLHPQKNKEHGLHDNDDTPSPKKPDLL